MHRAPVQVTALDAHARALAGERVAPPFTGERSRQLVEVTPEIRRQMRRMHVAGHDTREIGRAMDLSHQTVLRYTDETACEYARLAVERMGGV